MTRECDMCGGVFEITTTFEQDLQRFKEDFGVEALRHTEPEDLFYLCGKCYEIILRSSKTKSVLN